MFILAASFDCRSACTGLPKLQYRHSTFARANRSSVGTCAFVLTVLFFGKCVERARLP